MKVGHSLKKTPTPRIYPRCTNCNSTNIRIGYSAKLNKWFRKCSACNWINNYLEELPNGS
jgi:phage FluMu protein Com